MKASIGYKSGNAAPVTFKTLSNSIYKKLSVEAGTGITGVMKLGNLMRMPIKNRIITLRGLLPEKKRITVIIDFGHKHSERNSFNQINYSTM